MACACVCGYGWMCSMFAVLLLTAGGVHAGAGAGPRRLRAPSLREPLRPAGHPTPALRISCRTRSQELGTKRVLGT
eukprot:2051135-Rhodomonas_salina.2